MYRQVEHQLVYEKRSRSVACSIWLLSDLFCVLRRYKLYAVKKNFSSSLGRVLIKCWSFACFECNVLFPSVDWKRIDKEVCCHKRKLFFERYFLRMILCIAHIKTAIYKILKFHTFYSRFSVEVSDQKYA